MVEEEIETIKAQYESNKEAVVVMLIQKMIAVNLEVPKVVIQAFDEVMTN